MTSEITMQPIPSIDQVLSNAALEQGAITQSKTQCPTCGTSLKDVNWRLDCNVSPKSGLPYGSADEASDSPTSTSATASTYRTSEPAPAAKPIVFEYDIGGFKTTDAEEAVEALICLKLGMTEASQVAKAIDEDFERFSSGLWSDLASEMTPCAVGRRSTGKHGKVNPNVNGFKRLLKAFKTLRTEAMDLDLPLYQACLMKRAAVIHAGTRKDGDAPQPVFSSQVKLAIWLSKVAYDPDDTPASLRECPAGRNVVYGQLVYPLGMRIEAIIPRDDEEVQLSLKGVCLKGMFRHIAGTWSSPPPFEMCRLLVSSMGIQGRR